MAKTVRDMPVGEREGTQFVNLCVCVCVCLPIAQSSLINVVCADHNKTQVMLLVVWNMQFNTFIAMHYSVIVFTKCAIIINFKCNIISALTLSSRAFFSSFSVCSKQTHQLINSILCSSVL